MENSWKEEGITGWGSFVFKEKLKRLKIALKSWNDNNFGSIDQNIAALRNEISELDLVDDSLGLTEEEAYRKCEATASLLRHLHNRKSLLAQKMKFR